ncbi:MAG: sugar ABC transporter permease [Anaerolineae bacterium]|jgi:multiple sugar transport system permease protein|nr:sugar ABC transporter permease [Anaerolineae bacterium]
MSAADQSRAAPASSKAQITERRRSDLARQQRIWGWIFLSPWLIGFTIFTAVPIFVSLIFTFMEFSLSSDAAPRFIGLDNWIKLFNDPVAINALGVTFRFALIAVPVGIILPLAMAALLNSKHLVGKILWRPLYYLPYMVPAISSIFIWQAFLNGQTGWLNRVLRGIGIQEPPNWFQNESTILFAFLLMGVWGIGNSMLTMLATMQGVPTELYEAAEVDGAGAFTKFRSITLPMISPVIFYNLVLSVIGIMQYFVVPYVITRGTGNPNNSAYFFNMHLYKTSFTFFDMGYGSTQAWFIFIIALVLTVVLFGTSRRWVYYASGE